MGREARPGQGVHHAAAMPGSDYVAQPGFLIAKGDEVNLGVALEWLAVAAPWAIRIGALIVVPFRRSPAATQSWLLLFFVAPWLGLVLYLAIGRPYHPRWRRQRVAQLWPIIDRAVSCIDRMRPAARSVVFVPGSAKANHNLNTIHQKEDSSSSFRIKSGKNFPRRITH